MKKCNTCKIEKEINEFNKDRCSSDGLKYSCRECTKNKYSIYYKNNKEKEIERQTNYQNNNKSSVKLSRNTRLKKKYDTDILYRLKINTRNRIKLFLKSINFDKVRNGTFNIVGCTPTELKEHIEKQFTDGMNWSNYGFRGWHIDHIKPLASVENSDDVYKLCHYTNLQPMWAVDNYKKGDRII